MLINSPRAMLPEAGTSGAALWTPVIFGACAEANPVATSIATQKNGIRVSLRSRLVGLRLVSFKPLHGGSH